MEALQDFKELLGLFNANRVDYLIVGGYALARHGVPRFTGDLDILVKPDPVNAQRIIDSLKAFGFGSLDLSIADFTTPDNIIQLGVPPVRIDILASLTGVSWEEAEAGRVDGEYGDLSVFFIGRDQFVANKRALGRKKDYADLEALGED